MQLITSTYTSLQYFITLWHGQCASLGVSLLEERLGFSVPKEQDAVQDLKHSVRWGETAQYTAQ